MALDPTIIHAASHLAGRQPLRCCTRAAGTSLMLATGAIPSDRPGSFIVRPVRFATLANLILC